MDTIFASSPVQSDSERENRIKAKTKKRSSPRRRRPLEQQQESTDQDTLHEPILHRPSVKSSSNVLIDDVTGNITQLPDSVILRIDSSDTSSSIDEDLHEDEGDEYAHEGKFAFSINTQLNRVLM